jgi:hypothetical protein
MKEGTPWRPAHSLAHIRSERSARHSCEIQFSRRAAGLTIEAPCFAADNIRRTSYEYVEPEPNRQQQ